ncbi:unnamed protein product [Closterium sp. NIES-53]
MCHGSSTSAWRDRRWRPHSLLLPLRFPPFYSPAMQVALMKKKVPWLKYERMKRHVREMEVAVEARLKERDDLQTQVMAARDPLVALKESRGGFASLVAKIGRENEARERKLRELSEESDQLVRRNKEWGEGEGPADAKRRVAKGSIDMLS